MLSEMVIVWQTISGIITLFLCVSESNGKEKRKDKKKGICLLFILLIDKTAAYMTLVPCQSTLLGFYVIDKNKLEGKLDCSKLF